MFNVPGVPFQPVPFRTKVHRRKLGTFSHEKYCLLGDTLFRFASVRLLQFPRFQAGTRRRRIRRISSWHGSRREAGLVWPATRPICFVPRFPKLIHVSRAAAGSLRPSVSAGEEIFEKFNGLIRFRECVPRGKCLGYCNAVQSWE